MVANNCNHTAGIADYGMDRRNIVEKSQLPFPYWDYYGISYIAYFSILAVIAGILGIRLRRWTDKKGNIDKFLPGLLFIAGTLLMLQFFYKHENNLNFNWYGRYSGDIFCNIPFWGILLLCLTGAGMTIYAIRAFFRLQSAGRIQRFRISPNLLCYLFWGITIMWTLYLLSLPGSSGVVDVVIIACLKITACIGSILCGLALSGPYPKKYFQIINICALVLLIAVFACSIYSCHVCEVLF